MTDPLANLAQEDRCLVISIATAIGNGLLLPHNRTGPAAARRVFDELVRQGRIAPVQHPTPRVQIRPVVQ